MHKARLLGRTPVLVVPVSFKGGDVETRRALGTEGSQMDRKERGTQIDERDCLLLYLFKLLCCCVDCGGDLVLFQMNMTRILWSKNFNCSFPRAETVPVIAVSSFMLFLPIIFYLSSFLHSEQKKRKLIQRE